MAFINRKNSPQKRCRSSVMQAIMQEDPYAVPIKRCKLTTQDSVPIEGLHEKLNLIEPYSGMYTRSYRILATNYQTETEDAQKSVFVKLRNILNSIGANCEISFTVVNRDIDKDMITDLVLLKERGDDLDYLRRVFNEILLDRIREGRNGITKEIYVTLGIHAADVRKASAAFARLDRELDSGFRKMGSEAKPLSCEERMELLYDIYHPDRRGEFLTRTRETDKDGIVREHVFYDFDNARRMGLTARDMVAPTSIQYYPRHIRIGRKYVRVMQVVTLPNALSDEFFMRLTDVNFNMVTTINIRPIQSKVANAMVHRNIVLAQTRKSDEMKNLIAAGLPEEMVSPETEDRVERALALRNDMINDDEKLFKVTYPKAALIKCIDRCNNLTTMSWGLSRNRIYRMILETEEYYPKLIKTIKATPEYNNAAWLLQYQIESMMDIYKRLM